MAARRHRTFQHLFPAAAPLRRRPATRTDARSRRRFAGAHQHSLPDMKIRVVIVDDEAPARARIRQLLRAEADFEIVGEFANGRQAIVGIQRDQPDLAFLDVQMPRLNGFDVCEALATPPLVVFVTAYDQYALQAFDVHAIDYLLKPFDRDRFRVALARARERLERNERHDRVDAVLGHPRAQPRRPGRVAVRGGVRILLHDWSDVDGREAA